MKWYYWMFLAVYTVPGYCQKPPLERDDLGKWPRVTYVGISNDGKYGYSMMEDASNRAYRLTIEAFSHIGRQSIEVGAKRRAAFSEDSRFLIFGGLHDSVGIVDLKAWSIKYMPGVGRFQLSANRRVPLLAIPMSRDRLTLYNLLSGDSRTLADVDNYQFSDDGRFLAVAHSAAGILGKKVITLFDVLNKGEKAIWMGDTVGDITFDRGAGQVAFWGITNGERSVYLFKVGDTTASPWVSADVDRLPSGWGIAGAPMNFSRNGERLLFSVVKSSKAVAPIGVRASTVDVWRYRDHYLQTEQLSSPEYYKELLDPSTVLASVAVGEHRVTVLQDSIKLPVPGKTFGNFIYMYQTDFSHYPADPVDPAVCKDFFWVSLRTGEQEQIVSDANSQSFSVSPEGRYFCWFDTKKLEYWCFDGLTRKKINISELIPTPLYDSEAVAVGRRDCTYGLAGWAAADSIMLVYDHYDIWKVALSGRQSAVCLTNGLGRADKMVLGIVNTDQDQANLAETNLKEFSPDEGILLAGFSREKKESGFFSLAGLRRHLLKRLIWGPEYFYIPRIGETGYVEYPQFENFPRKAKDCNAYLIARMTEREYPNWWYTRDFKVLTPVTDLHPEVKVNWLTTKLVHWRMPDGRISQGILYRPENFDSTRKYPVIFTYYEKRSDQLHQYLFPDYTRGRIDIPYFVSNGYVVFVPDIYYKQGHNGIGVVNAVQSAARYLERFPWVDSTRFGLQGHSFGGWETNYLITHTTLFKAACEAAGVSDQISGYDELQARWGVSRQWLYESLSQGSPYGQDSTPWSATSQYLENSPVIAADRVVTPLLMMQGDNDPSVPFGQSIEFFMALRRAGKKVWLLQYEKEGHQLGQTANAVDFTVRIKQFFDYYLMNAAPPRWMTQGVPLFRKGTGLELDSRNAVP